MSFVLWSKRNTMLTMVTRARTPPTIGAAARLNNFNKHSGGFPYGNYDFVSSLFFLRFLIICGKCRSLTNIMAGVQTSGFYARFRMVSSSFSPHRSFFNFFFSFFELCQRLKLSCSLPLCWDPWTMVVHLYLNEPTYTCNLCGFLNSI